MVQRHFTPSSYSAKRASRTRPALALKRLPMTQIFDSLSWIEFDGTVINVHIIKKKKRFDATRSNLPSLAETLDGTFIPSPVHGSLRVSVSVSSASAGASDRR